MKTLKEFILETKKDYNIENINVYDVLRYISKGDYKIIKEHIEEAEEIDEDSNILYLNGKNTSKNIYTNLEKNSPYQWILLKNNDRNVAIQLLKFESKESIELVIAERSKKAKDEHNTFENILNKVIEKYNPKEIHTFALADKLKEKYIKCGFKCDKENQLTLKL